MNSGVVYLLIHPLLSPRFFSGDFWVDSETICSAFGVSDQVMFLKNGNISESIAILETNIHFAPENGWLEYDPFLLGRPIFRGFGC